MLYGYVSDWKQWREVQVIKQEKTGKGAVSVIQHVISTVFACSQLLRLGLDLIVTRQGSMSALSDLSPPSHLQKPKLV